MAWRWRWWHGLAFYAGVRMAGWTLSRAARRYARRQGWAGDEGEDFYRRQRLPWFAPPPQAFSISWSVNAAGLIAAGLRILNLPPRTRGRRGLLALQAAGWLLFASFDAGYLELRSPANAAVITLPYAAVVWSSLAVAVFRLNDGRTAIGLTPAAAWMLLAVPLSLAQARLNPDPLWGRPLGSAVGD